MYCNDAQLSKEKYFIEINEKVENTKKEINENSRTRK